MPPSTTPARSSAIKTKTKLKVSLALSPLCNTHATPNAQTRERNDAVAHDARAKRPARRAWSIKEFTPDRFVVNPSRSRVRGRVERRLESPASDPRSSNRSIDRYAPFRKPRAVRARRPASRSRVAASRMKRKVFFTRRRSLARVATSRARVGTHTSDAREGSRVVRCCETCMGKQLFDITPRFIRD